MVRCVIALWVRCIWWFVRLLGGLGVFTWGGRFWLCCGWVVSFVFKFVGWCGGLVGGDMLVWVGLICLLIFL